MGCTFFDLSKAFDSVPHQALLNKLYSLSVPPVIIKWIADYLSERSQRVVLNGRSSNWLPVKSGVPQGSIIGPLLFLLFLLFINDLCNVELLSEAKLMLYADDILLYKPFRSQSDIRVFQLDIDRISSWIKTNYLTINISKQSLC